MPFDLQAHIRDQAAHLLRLNSMPGWRAYAKQRRDELLSHPMYGQALRDELSRLQAKPSSTPSDGAPCEQS